MKLKLAPCRPMSRPPRWMIAVPLALVAVLLLPAQPAGAQTNSPPEIVGAPIGSGGFAENATGQVRRPYTATDPDGDTVTWSITHVDPASNAFAITPDTGIMTVEIPLDYEVAPRYDLHVTADDGNGGTDTHEFIILVNDVDEPPDRPKMPMSLSLIHI